MRGAKAKSFSARRRKGACTYLKRPARDKGDGMSLWSRFALCLSRFRSILLLVSPVLYRAPPGTSCAFPRICSKSIEILAKLCRDESGPWSLLTCRRLHQVNSVWLLFVNIFCTISEAGTSWLHAQASPLHRNRPRASAAAHHVFKCTCVMSQIQASHRAPPFLNLESTPPQLLRRCQPPRASHAPLQLRWNFATVGQGTDHSSTIFDWLYPLPHTTVVSLVAWVGCALIGKYSRFLVKEIIVLVSPLVREFFIRA
jgi:hypothetical protein